MSVWDLNSTYLNLPAWHIYSFSCSQKGKGVGMQKAATMWETSWTPITSCTYTDMKVIASRQQTCNLIQRVGKIRQRSLQSLSLSHFKMKFTTLLRSYLNKNNPMNCVAVLSYLIERCPSFGICLEQQSSSRALDHPKPVPPSLLCTIPSKAPIRQHTETPEWGHANKPRETATVPHDGSQGSCYQVQGINYLNISGCTLDSLRVL